MKATVINLCGHCSRFVSCLEKDNNMKRDEDIGYYVPGPDCPLPDLPQEPNKHDGQDEYAKRCVAFVEKLRSMK